MDISVAKIDEISCIRAMKYYILIILYKYIKDFIIIITLLFYDIVTKAESQRLIIEILERFDENTISANS